MSHNHPLHIVSFTGTSSALMSEAIEGAKRGLDDWYHEQDILFWGNGGSVFQFSTAAYETDTQFVFIITVFHPEYRFEPQPPTRQT